MTARILPGTRSDVGITNDLICRVGMRVAGVRSANLFTTLARQRRLFRAWLRFGGSLMPRGVLPRRETELVILRVAAVRECEYERRHHVRIGARAGLSQDDFDRVQQGPQAPGWSLREQAVLTATDELLFGRDISDATWDELTRHLDQRELVELTMLIAHYDMLATVISTLRIVPDEFR